MSESVFRHFYPSQGRNALPISITSGGERKRAPNRNIISVVTLFLEIPCSYIRIFFTSS